MRNAVLLSTATLIVFGATAHAAGLAGAASDDLVSGFNRADKDGDGRLSREEFRSISASSGSSASGGATGGGQVIRAEPSYSESMEKLLQAAQQLRESIQSMAQMQPGPQRDRAIREAKQALLETQRAMLDLPPALREDGKNPVQANYEESLDKLKQAADRLRESVQAMAQQQPGPRRNQAADQARQALFDTQQAMVALPNPPTRAASAGGTR